MKDGSNIANIGTVDEIEAIKKLDLPLTDDFRSIVLEERPLIDVRAPVEFLKGAFPTSTNLLLMNDEERHLIGIRYKEQGNAAAVQLGKELVGPVKQERVKAWVDFVKAYPDAYLYCFRGGQRSQISQAWLKVAGLTIPRLKGGYKAFRGFLMQESENISSQSDTLIIGGRTGSGKTLLLQQLSSSIDLEGLANHRGSSFGSFTTAQPTQINFEDALGFALIKHAEQKHKHLVIEDENRNIGKINIPKPVFDNFRKGKLIILHTPMKERVDITFEEYVIQALKAYEKQYGNDGAKMWFDDANKGLNRIKKRFGSERYVSMKTAFSDAYVIQERTGNLEQHKGWIETLLTEYYDPMYDYQLEKSEMPIVFEGSAEEILAYLS
jgi:tRNA 2-selenouridine synthase